MERPRGRQPGDLILDRYMPSATPEEREAARENLKRFARLIVSVADRKARERYAEWIRATKQQEVNCEEREDPLP